MLLLHERSKIFTFIALRHSVKWHKKVCKPTSKNFCQIKEEIKRKSRRKQKQKELTLNLERKIKREET